MMDGCASIVCQSLISFTIDLLFQKLSSEVFTLARRGKFYSELNKLQNILLKIQAVLDDAEEKQMADRSVKIWLDDLRDLAYDLEDLLDEFATEKLLMRRMKIKVSHIGFSFILNMKMGPQIKKMAERFQVMVNEKGNLRLKEMGGFDPWRVSLIKESLRSTSLVIESCVYGRENDKEKIVEMLIKNENGGGGDDVCVIAIFGMGGVGKTTLAQLVYNDCRIDKYFDLKAWVCVGDVFDVVRVTRTILEAITGEIFNSSDLNWLQVKLKECLSRKKYLIVLDDVWNENHLLWDVLRIPFIAGDGGSKIIVTTRNEDVALVMGAIEIYRVNVLCDDDCFSLFIRLALGGRNFDAYPELKVIGKEIVRKCQGLPLAAKVMGGLLQNKLGCCEWEDVLNSKMWDFSEEKNGILPALRVSYFHLPSYLKQLFVYCSIFPKGYKFDKDELVLLWMAEGFLPHQRGKKLVEDVGGCYFNELLARSLFERSSSNESLFVMHDLINDLANSVAKSICFSLEDKVESNEPVRILQKTRYMAFTRRNYEVLQRFKHCYGMNSLRTLLALPIHTSIWTSGCYLSKSFHHEMLPRLKRLRSLSLSGYGIRELPESIGDLKHLRYLNMSCTEISLLPESVSNLVNLQILNLRGCAKLRKLPSGIIQLINLHYLDIKDTNCLLEMPSGICNLTNLRKLTKFVVGRSNHLKLRELKELSQLRGELSIYGLHNVVKIQDAMIANLMEKHGLVELYLEWTDNFKDSRNLDDESCVLNYLEPNRSLEKLTVSCYGGTKFASWLEDPTFINIVYLSIHNCRKTLSLPSLWRLPSLKELSITGMDAIQKVCQDPSKPFPSLETLRFKSMLKWEWWNFPSPSNEAIEEIFPRLKHLTLQNCPELIGKLPTQVPFLKKLTISECPRLKCSLKNLSSLVKCNEDPLGDVAHFSSLTSLKLKSISELTSLLASNFMFLEVLQIESCPNLVLFPQIGLLSNLKCLLIKDCQVLKALPDEMMILSGKNNRCLLEELDVEDCPSLESFPNGKLPPTLKSLKIHCCQRLQSLPELAFQNDSSGNMSQLEKLEIVDCPSLTYLGTEKLPYCLKRLRISYCSKFERSFENMLLNNASLEYIDFSNYYLSSFPECLQCLSNLTEININSCPHLKFFPETGLPVSCLRTLYISNCESLKSLPSQMHELTSLRNLTISDCASLGSLPMGGFPLNLSSLQIWKCKMLNVPISKWKLHRLTSLKELRISGECFEDIISFPDKDCLLSGSLISLCIGGFRNLVSLSRGLNSLALLEELEIINCSKLQSLPWDSPPASLGRLSIMDCPCLSQRHFKAKEASWHVLACIPCVEVDGVCIQ